MREALRLARLDARRLELEVTENVMLNDVDGALWTMTALKELGVRLNMDDFGTGYSSLGYLRTYPFDSIKIDKRFVASMEKTGRDRSIVQAIINLGNALNLRVTAEGVETEGQMAHPARRAMPRTARVPAQPAAGCEAPARSAGARGGADPGAPGFRRRPCCAPALSGRQKGARGASAALGSAIALRMVQKMLN